MKELIFAWNILGLVSSLGIVSKSVVRSVNPQTYTLYCQNTLCGCCCSKVKCECKTHEATVYNDDELKIGNFTASGGKSLGGNALSADVDFSLLRFTEDTIDPVDFKLLNFSAGIDLVNGGGSIIRVGANLLNLKVKGIEGKIGLNLDTGGSLFGANGLELKVGGFGFSIGRKIEISTIIGGGGGFRLIFLKDALFNKLCQKAKKESKILSEIFLFIQYRE